MNIRTSLGEYACAALALLAVLSGAGAVLGQQVTPPTPPPGAANRRSRKARPRWMSHLLAQFRLGKRRKLRGYDIRNQLSHHVPRSEQVRWDREPGLGFGGWAGLKTGYFLDHIAFGLTGYTSQPDWLLKDRDGTLLLKPGQEGYSVLGEAYADIRIVEATHFVAQGLRHAFY